MTRTISPTVNNSRLALKSSYPHRRAVDSSLPPAVLERILLGDRELLVVRDDLLPGGTKQRGLLGALLDFAAAGKTEFIYASPFCGYAQLALSYLCRELGFKCTLFCERDPSLLGIQPHEYTLKAELWGAEIHLCANLTEATCLADAMGADRRTALTIPLGFDCPEFYHHYRVALQREWMRLSRTLTTNPQTLWVCVGSGTLMRSFQEVLKNSPTHVRGVNVHVLPDDDKRIAQFDANDLRSADLKFAQPTRANLGFPSNRFYDAKVIPFLEREAQSGDLFWNVGR